jgi:[acyl-carrier-protein] S-malonyltransferase
MKTAVLYAGQGAQHAGMGKDFYEKYKTFADAFDSANDLLSFDLHELCFEDPDQKLIQTQYTQPCMVAFAAGLNALFRENGVEADYVAGLSLGEYSALEAAGVLTARDAISLAAFRGQAMARAAEGIDCGMSAVLGLEEEALSECCKRASSETEQVVMICNYNCPGQLVISGQKSAVDKAGQYAQEAGARRVMPLSVSGPFHTSFMKSAGDALSEKFEGMTFNTPSTTVLYNYLGKENEQGLPVEDLLVKQVQNPVRMESIIRRLLDLGVRDFIEAGPGHALTGFVKKTAKAAGISDITVTPVETTDEFEKMLSDRMLKAV